MIAGAEAARRLEGWLHAVPLRLRVLAEVRASGVPAFIVGGTLRDALLGRESHDLDLAVAGDAISLARRVADAVGVAFVPLDREHDVARAVAHSAAGEEHFDFAGLRGADIDADLRARDFTVNAMGVAAAGPWERLLDPTGGRADLAAGVLRAAYDDAFCDDPLRVLRGVRLCGALDLQVDPHTETLMGAAASQLSRVSPERIRDELLQIVALPAAGELWRYSAGLGALAVALPPLGETDLVARSAERLDALVALEAGLAEGEPGALAPYGRRLAVDLGQVLPGGFSRGAVVRLAAACSALPGGHEGAQAVARQLRLSSAAARQVAQTVRGAEAILARPGGRWDARAVYRYYRETGEGGVAGGSAGSGLPASERRRWQRRDGRRVVAGLVRRTRPSGWTRRRC
jgi:hypothetical protein